MLNLYPVPSVLPDLELNGFGFKLLRPATDSRVDGYPYQVLINEYDRNVDIRYRVYFYDNDDNYLDYSKESFTGSNFNFNGVLSDDSILDSANTVWYASGYFEQDGYKIQVNSFGNRVNYYGTMSLNSNSRNNAKCFRTTLIIGLAEVMTYGLTSLL